RLRMKRSCCIALLFAAVGLSVAQEYNCPEPNGIFADAEQCDLYYVCEKGIAKTELCEDGLLFDDSFATGRSACFPTEDRQRVRASQRSLDHLDPAVCDKFVTCSNGTGHELPCTHPLVFDAGIGSCVRKANRSPDAKICDEAEAQGSLITVEGFLPGKEVIGPHNLLTQHPVYPHPSDCQFFFTCYFGKDPNKFGCPSGQVFDAESLICKEAAEVPDCACWYNCPEDCPTTNA
ncbi:Peritrophin-1, partial [Caligus rogercresseyi]